jgi:hypothetical protein
VEARAVVSFLNPAFLWALPALLAPVLLHLLRRKPPQKVVFSHIRWIQEAHRRVMPRRQLNHLLLLLTRLLFLLFLILFFAGPVFQPQGMLNPAANESALVVLIDESASIGPTLDLDALKVMLRRLPPSLRVGAVAYTDRVEETLAPTFDTANVSSWLQKRVVKHRPTDIRPAMEEAYRLLLPVPASRKKIVIVSDGARHGWADALADKTSWADFDPSIGIYHWEYKAFVKNMGVAKAHLDVGQKGLLKGLWVLNNPDGVSASRPWQLELNEAVSARGVVKAASSALETPLQSQGPRGGVFFGDLRLDPDELPFDDSFYLAGRAPDSFHLLLVDGQLGTSPIDSETYFLRLALESFEDPRLEAVQTIRPEALSEAHLNRAQVVVLANTGPMDDKRSLLLSWVDKGGGLIVSAGPNWIDGQTPLGVFDSRAPVAATERIDVASLSKDLFVRHQPSEFDWASLRVDRHVSWVPSADTQVLIKLEGGNPLLMRQKRGKGWVLGWATTLNRAWTNMPGKPVFAPLMRDQIFTLADPTQSQTTLQAWVDEPARFFLKPGVRVEAVTAPDGGRISARTHVPGMLDVPGLSQPGLYSVKTNQPEQDFKFAVNMREQDKEGNLTRASLSELKSVFPGARVEWVAAGPQSGERLLSVLEGKDLSNLFLALALLALVMEMLLLPRVKK